MVAFCSGSKFLEEHLPGLVRAHGEKPLSAMFVTYNEVRGVELNGLQETGFDDLRLVVYTGGFAVPAVIWGLFGLAMRSTDFEPRLSLELMQHTDEMAMAIGDATQRDLTERVDEAGVSADLIFVYVGVSAFEAAVAFAGRVAREHPASKVIAISCDCNNERRFERTGLAERVHQIVIIPECGGRADSWGSRSRSSSSSGRSVTRRILEVFISRSEANLPSFFISKKKRTVVGSLCVSARGTDSGLGARPVPRRHADSRCDRALLSPSR